MRKKYEYKIYSSTGVYLTTWTDVSNDPTFEVVINGGYVELVCNLARKTNLFGEEYDVAFNNELRLYCFDNDTPNVILIFCGYISRYEPKNDGPEDFVEVHFLGYHQRLTDFIFENAQGVTDITINSTDPAEMMKTVLNSIAVNGCPVSYTNDTLQDTGDISSYEFQFYTGRECADKVLELSPVGWFWYVDANKNFNLHPKQELPIHTFTVGKEIFYIDADKRLENVVNRIYFLGGTPDGATQPLYSRYEAQSSIQEYGLKSVKKIDQRVTLQSTMDTIADNILQSQKDPEIRCIIRVKDNDFSPETGYDIESIKIGDTCQVRNYQESLNSSKWDVMLWDTDFWDFNVRNLTEVVMQIVDIKYNPNFVELTISSKIPNIARRIEDINRNLVDSLTVNNPMSPNLGN